MSNGKSLGFDAPHAQRLRALREVLGFENAAAFAAYLGISAPRLSNVENGLPLSKEIAFRIVERVPGITTDWLWFGNVGGLTVERWRQLEGLLPPVRRS